ATGYGILILLLVAVFSYQVLQIHEMQSINQNLGGLSFRAALLSLQLLRDVDQVDEFTRKLFATGGDPDYASQVGQMREGFTQSLRELDGLALSPEEENEVNQLVALWDQDTATAGDAQSMFPSGDARQTEAALADQLALLSSVRVQTQGVIRATRLAIAAQVQQSEQAALRAQSIFLATALAALLLSVGVSLWIVRSISRPLRRLTEGTRAVADGRFTYRLDESGKDELAALARDFNWMTRRLSELDQMKKDFVSHVSHELKTPLASMQETVRLLLEELPGSLSAQQRRLLELNLQSAGRLSTLIANLLDLSRMDAGVMEYNFQRHDLVALLRSAVAEFEIPMRERHLLMESDLPEDPLWLECDGDRLIQVLDNLLGNAIKFSPPGGVVHIALQSKDSLPSKLPFSVPPKLSRWPNVSGYVMVSIGDKGPGIPANERARIFEKFHQVRGGSKKAGQGAGLGLSISRTIVEAHGGAIWVEDNPGGGSLFCILLPLEKEAPKKTQRASAPI
ncbi:MAG TPA: HAMP domain-containing sensor histidine kinase, partial [Terriglobales bacterium]